MDDLQFQEFHSSVMRDVLYEDSIVYELPKEPFKQPPSQVELPKLISESDIQVINPPQITAQQNTILFKVPTSRPPRLPSPGHQHQCQICLKSFKYKAGLANHKRTHAQPPGSQK